MFSFYGKSEPQTPNQEDRSSRASTPTSSKKKKKSSKGKPSFQMVELNEGGAPGSPDIESHHLHRTSTDIVNAAEGAEGMDLDGDISVVQSTGDGKQIKFKKAKKLRRAASKHYLKHLNDAKASRFRDWKRDQLIHAIVFTKKLELRGEKTIETEALRDLCESLFPPDEDMPAKHKGYDFGALVKRIVAARRIQNTWIIYQAVKREIQEENMADSYNSRIDDYDESNIQDLGRTELMMMMEGAQDDGRPSQSDVEAGGASKVPDDEANAGPSLAVAKARGKRNILDLPWTPPDYAKAVAYANYIQPRKGGKGGSKFDYLRTTTGRHCCLTGWGEQFDLWNEGQISEFSPYGPGITNYFKFLKWAFWVFVLLTVAALPCLVINMTGSTTDQGLSAIAQTTIGSLSNNAGGSLYYDNSTQAYVYNTTTNVYKTVNVRLPGCSNYGLVDTDCYLNGNSLALFYAIIDIIVSVIIFVGYVWLSVFEKLEESKLDENTVLASHYTVKVSRFPPETTEDQLKEHFTKLVGKRGAAAVADVSFAYNNSREILLCKARGDLIRRKVLLVHEHRFKCTAIRSRTDWTEEKKNDVIQRERDRLKETMNRYNDDLKRKDKELEEISKESPKPIAAFVTFNYVTDQRLALEKYTHRSFISMLCGHPELNLGGVTLKVRQAAEPSVIVWENMEFTESNRFGRNIATFLVSLLLVAISLAMIFSSKYLEQRSSNNGSSSSELCPSNFYAFTPAEQLAITEDFPNLLYCYCGELSLSSTEKVCQEYFTRQAQAQVLTYFASFIVIIVNNLIVRMVRYSAQFEKHHSSDGQSMSIFFRLFALKYINTAAVFLINGNNVILQKVFGLQDDTSSSVEFGTTWYSTVAVTIVLVQLGDAFNAQLGNLKDYFFLERRKRLSRENPKYALTQDELNRSHVGPQFEFAFTYAQIMSTFFVCLTFSTGIPILYPIAAFNFLLFYFMEKYMFIHLYKIPPHFTTMVGRRATALIPFAILMHLAMSIWMLSNNELFVADQKTESDPTLVSSFKFGSTIREKITGQATFPLFMTFCAIIIVHVLYFYYKYFRKTVDGLYDFLFGFVTLRKQEARIKREQKENWKAKVPFARAVLRNLIKGLSSYNILRNPEYKEAFGITWKFAVENKGVRAVRQMKAKAQAAVEEEDAEKAEELQRSTLASHSGGVGTSSATKPSKKVRNALKAVDSARNRSFYGALSAADDGAPRSGRETSGAGGSGRDGSGRDGSGRDGSGRGGSSGQQGGSGRSSGQQGGSGRSSGQQGGSGRSSHDQTPVSGSGSGRRNEQRPVSAAVTRAAAAPSTPQGTFMYAPQTASAHQQRPVSLPMSPVAVAGGAYHAVPPSPDPYVQQQRQQAQQQYRGGYQQVPQPPTR